MQGNGEREDENFERSKTLKQHRNRARKFPHVPNDVIEDILQKLQVKSLIRFKSVSKQWRSIIASHDFAEKHMIHQKSRDQKILVTSRIGDPITNLLVESISMGEEEEEIGSSFTLTDDFSDRLRGLESCDGLVCIYGVWIPTYVLNPATRELRKLPPPRDPVDETKHHQSLVGFGRDIVIGTYKVVRIFNWSGRFEETALCDIFDLNTDTWRHLSTVPYYCVYHRHKPVYARGSLYWIVRKNYKEKKIVALNLHTEKFHLVRHPNCLFRRVFDEMFTLKNRLCVLKRNSLWDLHIWAMDGGDGDERWEKIYSLSLHDKYVKRFVEPLTVCRKERVLAKLSEDVVIFELNKRHQGTVCTRKGAMSTAYFESLVSPCQ